MIENIISVICGRKGSGKSEFIKRNIYPFLNRMVVVDTQNEYGSGGEAVSELLDGTTVVRTMQEFRDAYCEQHGYAGFRIVAKFAEDNPEEIFDVVFRSGFCSLIVEEVDLFDSATASRTGPFFNILTKSRHKHINLFATTQRPANVSKTLTSQSDVFITFQQDEYIDLQYFSRFLGKDADQLRTLKVGEYKVVKGQEILDALLRHLKRK